MNSAKIWKAFYLWVFLRIMVHFRKNSTYIIMWCMKCTFQAFADVITAWGWDKYVVIYESHESLIRLQEILKESNPSSRQAFVKQLPPDEDYRLIIIFQTDDDSDDDNIMLLHINSIPLWVCILGHFVQIVYIMSFPLDRYLKKSVRKRKSPPL